MLAAASASSVYPMESATGTSQGAAMLVAAKSGAERATSAIAPADEELGHAMSVYAEAWKALQKQRSETSRDPTLQET